MQRCHPVPVHPGVNVCPLCQEKLSDALLVARRVGNEPVRYVANIYKYYIAYSMVEQRTREREEARGSPTR